MAKMITTVRITSDHADPHDEAVVRDPAFQAMGVAVVQAVSTFVAAKLGKGAPSISAEIVSVTHEN